MRGAHISLTAAQKTSGHSVRSSGSQMRSLQPTIGHNGLPALISALASEHKKTADLHAGCRLPRMECGSTPVAWSRWLCVIRINSSTSNRLGTQSVSIKINVFVRK